MGAGRRATSPTAPDRPGRFPVVTCVPVDEDYNFPRSELAAMAKNIARLIDDIDRLDINRRNMMVELQVLRDVTLFYNEKHPELRSAVRRPPREDTTTQKEKGSTTPEKPTGTATDAGVEPTPPPTPAATKEKSPGPAAKADKGNEEQE